MRENQRTKSKSKIKRQKSKGGYPVDSGSTAFGSAGSAHEHMPPQYVVVT
jgi:hypothetical protein